MNAGAKLNFSLFLQSRIPVPWISTMDILCDSPYLCLSSLIMFLQIMPEVFPHGVSRQSGFTVTSLDEAPSLGAHGQELWCWWRRERRTAGWGVGSLFQSVWGMDNCSVSSGMLGTVYLDSVMNETIELFRNFCLPLYLLDFWLLDFCLSLNRWSGCDSRYPCPSLSVSSTCSSLLISSIYSLCPSPTSSIMSLLFICLLSC